MMIRPYKILEKKKNLVETNKTPPFIKVRAGAMCEEEIEWRTLLVLDR